MESEERIINVLLEHKELSVKELEKLTKYSRETINKVVRDRKKFKRKSVGRRTLYSVRKNAIPEIMKEFKKEHYGFLKYLVLVLVLVSAVFSMGLMGIEPGIFSFVVLIILIFLFLIIGMKKRKI